MLTWQDAVGNVHGRVEGPDPDMPALLIGWAVMRVSLGGLIYTHAAVHAADQSVLTSSMKGDLKKPNFNILEDTLTSKPSQPQEPPGRRPEFDDRCSQKELFPQQHRLPAIAGNGTGHKHGLSTVYTAPAGLTMTQCTMPESMTAPWASLWVSTSM